MAGPKVGSGAGAGVPASDRKLVSSLKEIVPNNEEEIYAMLRECNRDPDETVQRLLSEGKFHVVKRKRDKKKESSNSNESADSRPRSKSLGVSGRSGKTNGTSGLGVGRGSSSPKYSTNEVSSDRGRTSARENSSSLSSKDLNAVTASLSFSQSVAQPKGSFSDTVRTPFPSSSVHSNGDTSHEVLPSNLQGTLLGGSGSSAAAGLQGAWLAGSGHATIADMLKSSGTRMINSSVSTPRSGISVPGSVIAPMISQQMVSVPLVSGVYLAASDPLLYPSLDPCAQSSTGVVNQEAGTVGKQQSIDDEWPSFVLPDTSAISSSHSHYGQLPLTNNISAGPHGDSDVDGKLLQCTNTSISSTMCLGEQLEGVQDLGTFMEGEIHSLGLPESSRISTLSPLGAALLGNQLTASPIYQAEQLVGTQTGGSTELDWGTQLTSQRDVHVLEETGLPSVGAVADGVSSCPSSPSVDMGTLSVTTVKLQELNVRDDRPVIIPDHLRVSEADCTRLSFGSFDSGFETFPSSLISEKKSSPLSLGGSRMDNEADVSSQLTSLSVTCSSSSNLDQHQHLPTATESLDTMDDGSLSSNSMVLVSQSEYPKPESTPQQSSQYSYLTAAPSYPVANLVTRNNTGQYAIEQSKSRSQDINPLANLQPYADPTATYYSGAFRSGPEVDARFSAFLPSTVSGKYGTGRLAGTGQSPPSQEGANAIVLSSSSQLSNSTATTVPQQSVPIHAYAQPSPLPIGPFANILSYQYMPPGFSYLQNPYQHNYTGTGSYHQVPSVGAGSVKYSVPQYKPVGGAGAGMQNVVAPASLGYGGYGNSQPGTYTINPPVTAGNTSGFDDIVPPYKNNASYIPAQQVEGSTLWLQAQLSREMPGGQGSSYYNIPAQNQQTRYSQAQSLHAHSHPGAAYGNLYHPQQSGPPPSAHQLIQPAQVLGSVGAMGTQTGSYQQTQRGQQTWTNSF